jgi:hypothetical protein
MIDLQKLSDIETDLQAEREHLAEKVAELREARQAVRDAATTVVLQRRVVNRVAMRKRRIVTGKN